MVPGVRPSSCVCSTRSGDTRSEQQEALRQLNALIAQTSLTAADSDFLAGIYTPSSVNTPPRSPPSGLHAGSPTTKSRGQEQ